MLANHLSKNQKIKKGSFYTPDFIVEKLFDILDKNNIKGNIIDTSCGYGAFARHNFYGFDLDKKAINFAKKQTKNANIFNLNSLKDIDKINDIIPNKKNIIVGNPPYNNFSSLYKKNKKGSFIGLEKYKSRDIGVSFLKSYNDINVNYVAVLHPLAFLVKKSNFNSLKEFKDNFKLIDSYVFSSNIFEELKNKTPFPIVIALYKRSNKGMDWDYIYNFDFNVEDTMILNMSKFSYIEEFATKYKQKKVTKDYKHFHTLRDINALFRNTTWLAKETKNSIRVPKQKIQYYKKLEIVKEFYQKNKKHFYFIGNLSPIVSSEFTNVKEFEKYILSNTSK